MRGKVIFHRRGNRYFVEGNEVTKGEYDRAFPPKEIGLTLPAHSAGAWPMQPSIALAIHPEQIPEFMEHDKKMGVPTDYDPASGEPIFRDRGHRREYTKVYGYHDRNAGYGDH